MSVVSSRLERRRADLRLVQRAAADVRALNTSLDERLAAAEREEDRMRLLREATYQITRAANDGIQAYRRVSETVRRELEMDKGDRSGAEHMNAILQEAKADLLGALDESSRRYPWAPPWRGGEEPGEELTATVSEELTPAVNEAEPQAR